MANLASSKKNIRKSLKRKKKNLNILTKIKKEVKRGVLTPATQKLIDKATKEKIIHPNKAARLKSKLASKDRSNTVSK